MTLKEMIVKWHGSEYGAQSALSRKLRIKRCAVSEWMLGLHRPSLHHAAQLAKLFGVETSTLIEKLPRQVRRPVITSENKKAILLTARLVLLHAGRKDRVVKEGMESIIALCKEATRA